MKLTNEMKDAFVEAVMRAIPRIHTTTDKEVRQGLETRGYQLTPPDVKRFMKKYPGSLLMTNRVFKGFPETYVDEAHGRLHGNNYGHYRTFSANVPTMVKTEDIDLGFFIERVTAADAEYTARKETRLTLRAAIANMTTDTQVSEAYPDLAVFLPKPVAKSYPIANPNLVKDLKAAGLKV